MIVYPRIEQDAHLVVPPLRFVAAANLSDAPRFLSVRWIFSFAFNSHTYMPQVWRMDLGPEYNKSRVITNEPPRLGAPYTVLVPQVNADGNDLAGIRLPEVAVPLGTYTGWNVMIPSLKDLG